MVSWTELATIPGVVVGGHALSPLIFLHLQRSGSFAEDSVILQQIVDKVIYMLPSIFRVLQCI